MSATCSMCDERPAKARGLCHQCYLKAWRGRDLVGAIPGTMTQEEASARRARIIQEMKAGGYGQEAIVERFGGRGVRSGEREDHQ